MDCSSKSPKAGGFVGKYESLAKIYTPAFVFKVLRQAGRGGGAGVPQRPHLRRPGPQDQH